jgi:hypothetical protein
VHVREVTANVCTIILYVHGLGVCAGTSAGGLLATRDCVCVGVGEERVQVECPRDGGIPRHGAHGGAQHRRKLLLR